MERQSTFGQRMKEARKAAKLKQQELADKTGIAVTSIRRYESGERSPTLDCAKEIAKALDADVNYLQNGQTLEERNAAYIAKLMASKAAALAEEASHTSEWWCNFHAVMQKHGITGQDYKLLMKDYNQFLCKYNFTHGAFQHLLADLAEIPDIDRGALDRALAEMKNAADQLPDED